LRGPRWITSVEHGPIAWQPGKTASRQAPLRGLMAAPPSPRSLLAL